MYECLSSKLQNLVYCSLLSDTDFSKCKEQTTHKLKCNHRYQQDQCPMNEVNPSAEGSDVVLLSLYNPVERYKGLQL